MSIISFLLFAITLGVFIYTLLDEDDTSLLQKRLDQISSKNKVGETIKKKEDIITFLTLYTRPLLNLLSRKTQNTLSIKNMLLEAGMPASDDEVLKFTAQRLLNCVYGAIFSFIIVLLLGIDKNSMLVALSLPILFFVLPIFDLKAKAKRRSEEISYNLPDALDLLTVCVEAGLGLDAAMSRVSKEFVRTSEVLASEFDRVSKDILTGVSRQDAFRNLALRNNIPEVKSFVALLVQTDKLGTSIAQSLRVHCDSVRTRRRQRVEEMSQKASVKMTIPMVFFILPALFVVVLAPALISLSKNMK